MQKWEYFDLWSFLHEKAPDLNVFGKDGWELVSVIHIQETHTTVHYFKRPIPQQPKAAKGVKVVKVVKHMVYRDGGTTEYKDANNISYFKGPPLHKDNSIYCDHPCHSSKDEEYRSGIRLKNIELEIVEFFEQNPSS